MSFYRILFSLVAVVITALSLSAFGDMIQSAVSFHYSWYFEFLAICGQVAFQWLFMGKFSNNIKASYAFILIMVSFTGAIMLWPLLLFAHYFSVSAIPALVYFFLVVCFMFIIHWKWVIKLGLPHFLCYTWILYRTLLLFILLLPL